jgi:hypothetical protein
MKSKILGLLAVGLLAGAASTPAVAGYIDYSVDVTGIKSYAVFGDSLNEVRTLNIGANGRVIGIGWNVTLLANVPSFLSEMIVDFSPSTPPSTGTQFLQPGSGDFFSGTGSYTSSGVVDLIGLNLDFNVFADGILRMEFYESFNDPTAPDGIDGIWQSGTLTVRVEDTSAPPVPLPAAAWLLLSGLGGLGVLGRRRKAA